MTLAAEIETRGTENIPAYAERGWPVLGVLPELSRDPLGFLDRLAARHGAMSTIRIGPHRVVVAAHPDAIRQVCVLNADNYEKSRFVEKLKPIIGNGLATSNGAAWEASHAVIQPALRLDQIRTMIGLMDGVVRETVAGWPEDAFDIGHEACTLTLKIVTATLLGKADEETARLVVKNVDDIQDYVSKYIWDMVPWRQALNAPSYRRFEAAMESVRGIVGALIEERKTAPRRDDLLQALIEAVDPETGEAFSEQQILDEVITLYMAGHDTTGNTLAFALHHLAADPELQEMVREEAMRCLPLDRPATFEDVNRLNLTSSLLKEVMRLYPSSWWFARTAIGEDELLGIPVHKGDVVMIAPYMTHRLPDYWDKPDTFDAFRFLKGRPSHKFAYIPFSAGPRMCPGTHLAVSELLLTIGRLMQRAELLPADELRLDALVTLRPRNGLMMTVRPWTDIVTVGSAVPGQHALVDALLRLRRKVFVDGLGWQLNVDEEGREIDEFDDTDSAYSAVISGGEIKSFGRVRGTDKPSLLFDVYPHLLAPESGFARGPMVWEGTRLGVNPDVPPQERSVWLEHLIRDAVARMTRQGASCFCSVSTLGMERVLRRLGVNVEALGDVHNDEQRCAMVALKINAHSEAGDAVRP